MGWNDYFCEELVAPGNPLRARFHKHDIIELDHVAPGVIHLFKRSEGHDAARREGAGHCDQIRYGGNRKKQNPVICPKREHLRQLHQFRLRPRGQYGRRVLFRKFLSLGGVIH